MSDHDDIAELAQEIHARGVSGEEFERRMEQVETDLAIAAADIVLEDPANALRRLGLHDLVRMARTLRRRCT